MKQIVFLIVDGAIKPSSLFGALEIFEKANEFYTNQGKADYYDIQLAGVNLQQTVMNASFFLSNLKDIGDFKNPDCIIIPGFEHKNNFGITNSRTALDWMITHYANGAEVVSLCTGAFLLAATGLLKGQRCATHWKAEKVFRTLFPEVKLDADKIITDYNRLYTSGGASSSQNLIIYLVEKHMGREAALYCAKVLQIDMERNSQSPFIVFEGLKQHPDVEIRSVQDFIETNMGANVTVNYLAGQCAMHRINFSRRFKKATQLSPLDYIQRVKIESAKRELESGKKNISEVMYSVGYTDVKSFRAIFKKVAGITPLEYRNKFSHA